MCYAASCDPLCGKCHPPRVIEATCPLCGSEQHMGREQYLIYFKLPHRKTAIEELIIKSGRLETPTCKSCGADMAETFRAAVAPAECTRSRVVCGFPCGRRDNSYHEGGPCDTMVPLRKLDA